jgi:hypothetical protein
VKYPRVRDEHETLKEVLAGRSIARYGDGEFKIVRGLGCVSQVADRHLKEELANVLLSPPSDPCLRAIPRLDPQLAKNKNWSRYEGSYPQHLASNVTYYSAFISRPDSAPHIWTPEFYNDVASLWRDEKVVLVSGTERSLTADFLTSHGARHVHNIVCARRDAYADIDSIERSVIKSGIKRAILCAGPMATCLAHRLAQQGVHAIDLGHIGMFWYHEGETKWKK